MRHSLMAVTLTLLLGVAPEVGRTARLDKGEARSAAEHLNRIRKNPGAFSKEIGVDLSGVTPRPPLAWNDTLAKVAEAKALDMATRNYTAHVDPDGRGINHYMHAAGYLLPKRMLRTPAQNSFESLQAGFTMTWKGRESVNNLVADTHTPNLGHRIHLLGMSDFNAAHTDIGVGVARRSSGSEYKTYVCFVIAHKLDEPSTRPARVPSTRPATRPTSRPFFRGLPSLNRGNDGFD